MSNIEDFIQFSDEEDLEGKQHDDYEKEEAQKTIEARIKTYPDEITSTLNFKEIKKEKNSLVKPSEIGINVPMDQDNPTGDTLKIVEVDEKNKTLTVEVTVSKGTAESKSKIITIRAKEEDEEENEENDEEKCCKMCISKNTKELNCLIEDKKQELEENQEKIKELQTKTESDSDKNCNKLTLKQNLKKIEELEKETTSIEEEINQLEEELEKSKETDETCFGDLYQELIAIKEKLANNEQDDKENQEIESLNDEITIVQEDISKLEEEINALESLEPKTLQQLRQLELNKKLLENKKEKLEILKQNLVNLKKTDSDFYFEEIKNGQDEIMKNLALISKNQLIDINFKISEIEKNMENKQEELKKIDGLLSGLEMLCPDKCQIDCAKIKCENSSIIIENQEKNTEQMVDKECCNEKVREQKKTLQTQKSQLEKQLNALNREKDNFMTQKKQFAVN